MSEQDKQQQTKAAKPAKKKNGFFSRVARWFRELKSELKKVQWPTWKQTWNNTLTVIACVIFVGIFLWAFDWLARLVIQALYDLVSSMKG